MSVTDLVKYWPDPKSAAKRLLDMIEQDKPEGDDLVTIGEAQKHLEEADRLLL
jgi:hypothetical protein